jgi:hypothetical protein
MVLLSRHARRRHGFGGENRIELRVGKQPPFTNQFTNRTACQYRRLGDVRSCRIADIRTERRGQCGAPVEQITATVFVGADPVDAARLEDVHRLRQDAGCMKGVPRDHRHHDVQLQLSRVSRGQNRGIAPHDLKAHLIDHLRD